MAYYAKFLNETAVRLTVLMVAGFGLAAPMGALAQDAAPAAPAVPAATPENDASYEKTLVEAGALIKAGKAAQAYALLEPLEFDHAGDERFDYLIGVAALDSGRPDKATFALERVLAANPDSAAARLDLARAYFQLGDFSRARTEFRAVSQLNISSQARANIEKYLEEIDGRESGDRTHMSGYLEGTAGHDSNVNFATDQTQILVNSIPVGPIKLAPANIETPESYRALAAGGSVQHIIDGNWQLDAGADWKRRAYNFQSQFDTVSLDGRAGVAYRTDAEHFRLGVTDGRNRLGGVVNFDTTGVSGEWRHTFSPSNQANLYVQQVNYRYADVLMKPNDFNQQTLGLGWSHVSADGLASVSGSLYGGKENDVSHLVTTATPVGGRADGPKRFIGFRLGGQSAAGDNTILFLNGGVQVGHYERVNPLFLIQRNDRFSDLMTGANWRFAKYWTLRPQLNFSKNSSNIVIYGYVRREVSLSIRRDFR